jgi:VWFA-related protein
MDASPARLFTAFLVACLAPALAGGAPAPPAGPSARPGETPSFREFVRVVDRPWQRIGLTVTVIDRRGRPVRGLGRDDFHLLEDDRPVAIADFGVEGARTDRPLSVAVLLDFSESMRAQVKKVREAALALLRSLRLQDEIMVAKFNDELTVLQTFTGERQGPERTLEYIGRAWGGTALFRSVEQTLKDLRERPGRKVILVVSDGLDNDVARDQNVLQSLYLQDLLRLCLRTGTVVYGVRPGMAATSWLPFEGFVEESGGRLLYTGGDLERLFERLGEEFLSQYYLAYDIDPKIKEGKRRRIRVEVGRPDVVVKAIGGYFTPRSHLKTLLADLEDEDPSMRGDAAYELGFTGEAEAVRALATALGDRDAKVRRLAAEGLGRLGDESALPALVEALGDRDGPVREAAGGSLLLFGPAAAGPLAEALRREEGRRKTTPRMSEAADLLGRLGDERAIGPLAALLAGGPPDGRVAAARALGSLGLTGGIPALRAALSDADPPVRGAALRSIVAIAGREARPVVEDYLTRETDPELRRAAAAALASP